MEDLFYFQQVVKKAERLAKKHNLNDEEEIIKKWKKKILYKIEIQQFSKDNLHIILVFMQPLRLQYNIYLFPEDEIK